MEAFYGNIKKSQSWIIIPDILWNSLGSTKTVAFVNGFIFNHISTILTFYITAGDLPKRNISFYSADCVYPSLRQRERFILMFKEFKSTDSDLTPTLIADSLHCSFVSVRIIAAL